MRDPQAFGRLLLLGAALAAFGGCQSASPLPQTEWAQPLSPLPSRPAHCRSVVPGEGLQQVLDTVGEGDAVCLSPGTYRGPLAIRRKVTVWGPRQAVVESAGRGTTVEVLAAGTELLGFTVDGSGGRFDVLDAAVHVTADHVRVEGMLIRNATFGLLIEKSNQVIARGNLVQGPDRGPLGLRGDGIRLWETRDSEISDNLVIGSRDMVVWYSSGNRIQRNTVVRSRYGTHFMYSHNNTIEGNRYIDNVVGIFIMYSRNLGITDCLFARSSGPGGMGLGIKESGNLRVANNLFVANTTSVYMDTSPLQEEDFNTFEGNGFYLSDVGVLMHSSEKRNAFLDNAFVSNDTQVEVEGGGNALGVRWEGNAFDDYAGYDMDGDRYGDIPYELRRLSTQLKSSYPNLQFFRGTVALEFLDAVSSLFPMVEPRKTLVDARPAMDPREIEVPHAR